MWQEERQATGKRSLRKTDNSDELRAVFRRWVFIYVYLLFCFLIVLWWLLLLAFARRAV